MDERDSQGMATLLTSTVGGTGYIPLTQHARE